MDREQIQQILTRYFANQLDVRMAFLFGSVERGVASTESDVDVAVYLEKEGAEGTLWTDIERLVGCEVDLIVLNRAPALVAWSAIRGTPLLIRDRGFSSTISLKFPKRRKAWRSSTWTFGNKGTKPAPHAAQRIDAGARIQ